MAHIPKRAVQHALFLPSSEQAQPTLKVGETALWRTGLYVAEAEEEREVYTKANEAGSLYQRDYQRAPEDYKNPQKPLIPASLRRTKEVNPNATASIWQSTSRATLTDPTDLVVDPHEVRHGPLFRPKDVPKCLTTKTPASAATLCFGAAGHRPRDTLPADSTHLKAREFAKADELNMGSTRGTQHIAGFQGYLPRNNDRIRAAADGGEPRAAPDPVVENYHLNPPGYSGHLPTSAHNDKGARQLTTMTTSGASYGGDVQGWLN